MTTSLALNVLYWFLAIVAGGFLAVAISAAVWMFGSWNDPVFLETTDGSPILSGSNGDARTASTRQAATRRMHDLAVDAAASDTTTSFSLLVPARHEADVLGATLDLLARLDHPDFEVIAIVGDDDPATAAVAHAAGARWPGRVRVVVDDSVPKSKPAALNVGLAVARGEVVGVFDAEDDVSVDILRAADLVFAQTGADVVQGTVQLVTLRDRWFSARNCLEYLVWFRGRLLSHARQGFVPLGGNTVFINTHLLRDAGGWDAQCLAEDCELGIRLSARGARIAVSYEPSLATREETPPTVESFVRQRTRWNQGFLQVLRKGWWQDLPTRRQRALAAYVLAFPYIQSAAAMLTPLLIVVAIWAPIPLGLTLWMFTPLLAFGAVVVIEAAVIGEMARLYHVPVSWRDSVRIVWSTIPYLVLLAIAALRAVWRESRGYRGWEKTAHSGAHRHGIESGARQNPARSASAIDLTAP